jgi:predicted aspartyl protease
MKTSHTALVAAFFVAFSGFANADDAPARTFDPVLDADPFASEALLANRHNSPAVQEYLMGVVADSELDTPGAIRHLRAAWSARGTSDAVKWRALLAESSAILRAGRYGEAADILDRLVSDFGAIMPASVLVDAKQGRDLAMALRDAPAQTVDPFSPGSIPLSRDALGLIAGPVDVNGIRQDMAVIDTGTSISTVSASAAKALGLHAVGRTGAMRSATHEALATDVAIADTLRIGPATLHHVPFIVVDDVILAPLGMDKKVDAIIGFSVLSALGRIGFEGTMQQPRQLDIAPSHKSGPAGNLRFSSFNPYVRFTANDEPLTFFVDSGARKSGFDKRYARENANKIAGLARKKGKVGGAGGVEERDEAIIPSLDVKIGDETVVLHDVTVDLNGSGTDDNYGSIGMDVLWAKGGYTIDFAQNRLTLGPP